MFFEVYWCIFSFCLLRHTSGLKANSKGSSFSILGLIPGGQGPLVSFVRKAWNVEYLTLIGELAPQSKGGAYLRPESSFQTNGIPSSDFPLELNRYHLYVGNPCPWCHRASLARALRGLDSTHLSLTMLIDDPTKASKGGWIFSSSLETDPIFGKKDLRGVYEICCPGYNGKITAPILVDKISRRIVSNESKDIVGMIASLSTLNKDGMVKAVAQISSGDEPPYVENNEGEIAKRVLYWDSTGINKTDAIDTEEIERLNEFIYSELNNGVYQAGFATQQDSYQKAAKKVSNALMEIEQRLESTKYLLSDSAVCESDIFLLPTIERFDAIYHTLFRCSGVTVAECPNIRRWHKDMRNLPGVSNTFDLQDATRSYYQQMFPLNPSGIIPTLPGWQVQQ